MTSSIVTVVTPASTYDLTDIDVVKDELDIADGSSDGKLQRWISEESQTISDYTGRVFAAETVSEVFRFSSSGGCGAFGSLSLSRYPVISITSVTEDIGGLLTEAEYEIDADAGLVYRICNGYRIDWRPWNKVTVVYSGGFATIPPDLAGACIGLVKHRWSGRGRDPALKAMSIEGLGQEQYWVGGTGDVGDLPPDIEAKLSRYRRVRV